MNYEYQLNDVVRLSSGKRAIIVGTKDKPYHSPIYHQDYLPEEGFDYIILYHAGTDDEDKFEGKDNVNESQIDSFVKHIDFE